MYENLSNCAKLTIRIKLALYLGIMLESKVIFSDGETFAVHSFGLRWLIGLNHLVLEFNEL